jgi:hypothetical protein
MARLRTAEHAEDEPADSRKKTGSAAGRKKTGPATGRKRTGAATGRKKNDSAAGRRRTGAATGPRRTRPAVRRRSRTRGRQVIPVGVLLTAGGVLAAVGVIALAGWLLTFPLGDLRYTSGVSGTPGTFTAVRCHTTGADEGSTRVCTGTFVAAEGGFTDRTAQVRDADIDVGRPATLRRRPDGGYVQASPASAGKDLAAAFGIISLAAFLLVALCVSPPGVSAGGWKRLRANRAPWGTLLTVLVPLFGASLALAALSALIGSLLSRVF